jgi:hypothetical protein
LPAGETPLRDRRLTRTLDPQQHHLAQRSTAVLKPATEVAIENLLDADWRAFTTLAEARDFLEGATRDDRLREFTFLADWPDFTEEEKLRRLADHGCHEFHLFLARKDQAFFETHVKSLLAQKPEPTFIDDLLLSRDLNPYLRPYAWKRLNAAEKALLAQALPAARERISRELALRWQIEAPTPAAETRLFTQTLRARDLALRDRQNPGASARAVGAPKLLKKLNRIVIPRIDFENVTLEEAIAFLRLRAAELDNNELDPANRGVNFVIWRPTSPSDPSAVLPNATDPGILRIQELRLRNVPLDEALKYLCDLTKLRFIVDDFAVTVLPETEAGEEIFTRSFQVPPDFAAALDSESSFESPEVDPFASPPPGASPLVTRKPIADLLQSNGVHFGEGASATLDPDGILQVTNTASEFDKIEGLTLAVRSSTPADDESEDLLGPLDPLSTYDLPATSPRPAPRVVPFTNHTKLWREANYFKHAGSTDESLIPLNAFWLDLAAWDGQGRFLSAHFNACTRNANEALLCLSLLDLPFKAERPEITVDGSQLRVKAHAPMLLFFKDIRRTENLAAESPLLVRQIFRPLEEPFRTVNGREIENPVTGDLQAATAYSASLVVTNPTGTGRRIDLLAQIPAGAIPLGGKSATLSSTHELKPYGVVKAELEFYFPAAGEFPVYPLQVSEQGQVVAHTAPRSLRVINEFPPMDPTPWYELATEGSGEEVLARLRTESLASLDFRDLRWRLKDPSFFQQVTSLLRERMFFSPTVSAYGFLHHDVATIREYLENTATVQELGDWLDSPLLTVRPRIHHDWATLEFDPLVNPRAHRFTDKSRLTHQEALTHYQKFLDQLG